MAFFCNKKKQVRNKRRHNFSPKESRSNYSFMEIVKKGRCFPPSCALVCSVRQAKTKKSKTFEFFIPIHAIEVVLFRHPKNHPVRRTSAPRAPTNEPQVFSATPWPSPSLAAQSLPSLCFVPCLRFGWNIRWAKSCHAADAWKPVEVGSWNPIIYKVFAHLRWCRISSINSSSSARPIRRVHEWCLFW